MPTTNACLRLEQAQRDDAEDWCSVYQESASHWAQMDKLVLMREQGKLDEYVSDTRRKCEQDNVEPDPDTMRAQASTQHPYMHEPFARGPLEH